MSKSRFFKLQFKRCAKFYPVILMIMTITIAAVMITALALMRSHAKNADKQKIRIGIVGDVSQTHLGIGIYALQNLDSSRFSVEFLNMEADEAKKALENREISGYVYIPPEFVSKIVNGENIPATYVTNNLAAGLGSILTKEITHTVSDIVTTAQTSVYSMQDVAHDFHADDDIWGKITKFNLLYFNAVLSRNKSYTVNYTGIANSLSLGGYYVCSILLIFLLLWGICCNRFFLRQNITFFNVLYSRGIKSFYQVICLYFVYVIFTCITILLFAFAAGGILDAADFGINELRGVGIGECVLFAISIFPAAAMIASMHLFLYEAVLNPVGALLLQFLTAIVQAYIAGCFYPNYFFPEGVRTAASFLPGGVGLSYMQKLMCGESFLKELAWCGAYIFLFMALSVFARKKKAAGDIR